MGLGVATAQQKLPPGGLRGSSDGVGEEGSTFRHEGIMERWKDGRGEVSTERNAESNCVLN